MSHPIQYQAPLLRRLAQEPGLDLSVLFLSDYSMRAHRDPEFDTSVQWDVPLVEGYDYVVLDSVGGSDKLSRLRPMTTGLREAITSERFDILWVHGYAHPSNLRAIRAARRVGVPVMLRGESWKGLRHSRAGEAMRSLVLPRFFASIAHFLAIGTLNREFYEAYDVPKRRITLMPYCVDNDFWQREIASAEARKEELRRSLEIEDDRPVILFAGKLTKRKRPFDLLNAYIRLSDDHSSEPAAHLVFVGDGAERVPLVDAIARVGWRSIHHVAFKNQKELAAFYSLADIFVLPAEQEPWGLAVNEAMNGHAAIIVSDQVGATADLVTDGVTGLVFPAGDVDRLARCLAALVDDPNRRQALAAAARERIDAWGLDAAVEGFMSAVAKLNSAVTQS